MQHFSEKRVPDLWHGQGPWYVFKQGSTRRTNVWWRFKATGSGQRREKKIPVQGKMTK